MVSHVQVPTNPGKENTFTEGKTDSESQFSNFRWLGPCQERSLFSSCWTLLSAQDVRASPFWPLNLVEVSVYYFFSAP